MLAGVMGLLISGHALAAKVRVPESSGATPNAKNTTVKVKKKAIGGHALHVHVRNSAGKAVRRATVTVRLGRHKVVRRADRAGHASIMLHGRKDAKVMARSKSHAHGTAHASAMGGNVTVTLHGGRHSSGAAVVGKHAHALHHRHQLHNLGTRSSKSRTINVP
jgi:hypothetical protein